MKLIVALIALVVAALCIGLGYALHQIETLSKKVDNLSKRNFLEIKKDDK